MAILGNDPPDAAPQRELARRSAGLEQREVVEEQWRSEFPYRWCEDDLVTRRDTLRFLVAGAGALFVATAALDTIAHISG